MRALLIEPDPLRRSTLRAGLRRNGCMVKQVGTAAHALRQVAAQPSPDILLLGRDLPDIDSLTLCGVVRQQSQVPIIMLADGDSDDCVNGLNAGADDYLTTPIRLPELVARINALGRRCGTAGSEHPVSQIIDLGPMRIDLVGRTVEVNGVPASLTRKEFDVLAMLSSQPGTIFERSQITRRVWRQNHSGLDHTLDSHIASLRSKLAWRALIKTVRGVGYRVDIKAA